MTSPLRRQFETGPGLIKHSSLGGVRLLEYPQSFGRRRPTETGISKPWKSLLSSENTRAFV